MDPIGRRLHYPCQRRCAKPRALAAPDGCEGRDLPALGIVHWAGAQRERARVQHLDLVRLPRERGFLFFIVTLPPIGHLLLAAKRQWPGKKDGFTRYERCECRRITIHPGFGECPFRFHHLPVEFRRILFVMSVHAARQPGHATRQDKNTVPHARSPFF